MKREGGKMSFVNIDDQNANLTATKSNNVVYQSKFIKDQGKRDQNANKGTVVPGLVLDEEDFAADL